MRQRIGPILLLAVVALAAPAAAGDVTIRTYLSDDTLLRIGPYTAEGGKTLNLTVGIGSSAFRRPTTHQTSYGRSATAAPTSHAATWRR